MVGKLAMIGVVVAGLMAGGCKCDCNKTTEKTASGRDLRPVQDAPAETTGTASGKIVPVNSYCPLGKHTFNTATRDADTSRSYKGSTIGFCCEDCSEKFDTMTAAQKDEVLAAAKANKPL